MDGARRVELDVTDFGARGDGLHPDGDAVRRAMEALPAEGGRLRFPAGGRYLLDSVELTRPRLTLLAEGATLLKAPEPAWHLFWEAAGRADGFRCVGGRFEMGRSAFRPGETVSPFFFVRARRLSFEGIEVRDGIEEGIKLYGCQEVRVLHSSFHDLRNNGVQFHAPDADGFRGQRPPQDAAGLRVEACHFARVDDGMRGLADGIGVAVHGTSATLGVRDVRVRGCTVEDCVRGLWAEFNTPGNPGRAIHFESNTVVRAAFHGIGMVGVHGGSMRGNRIFDTGVAPPDPPRSSEYIGGLVVSGSDGIESEGLVVAGNTIEDRRPEGRRLMQYGIVLNRGHDLRVSGEELVRGATIAPVRRGAGR